MTRGQGLRTGVSRRLAGASAGLAGVGDRGTALLAVLWLSVVLTFIALALSATVRTEVEAARNLVEEEQGYFLARGALEAALRTLTSPPPPPDIPARRGEFRPGQREMAFEFETGTATVEVETETGKLDLNNTPPEILGRLFTNLGVSQTEAAEMALAVDHWRRPPVSTVPDALDLYYGALPHPYAAGHQKFETLEELLLVRGMTADLFYGGFVRGSEAGTKSGWQPQSRQKAPAWMGRRPPLSDLLAVRYAGPPVDPNYAHPLLLASLPGLDATAVEALIRARQVRPFRSLEEALKSLPGNLPGATLSYLALSPPQAYTLVARGRAKGAGLERSVRLTFVIDTQQALQYRLLDWNDRP